MKERAARRLIGNPAGSSLELAAGGLGLWLLGLLGERVLDALGFARWIEASAPDWIRRSYAWALAPLSRAEAVIWGLGAMLLYAAWRRWARPERVELPPERPSAPDAELDPRAILMLETLLAADDEALTLETLRQQTPFAQPVSGPDFKLLVHSLTSRGLALESPAPPSGPRLPSESRLMFPLRPRPIAPSLSLTQVGKDFLVQHREGLAAKAAERQRQLGIAKGMADANASLRRRNPWKLGDE